MTEEKKERVATWVSNCIIAIVTMSVMWFVWKMFNFALDKF
jgi:hypothetical protein